jgi:hypothetical protein
MSAPSLPATTAAAPGLTAGAQKPSASAVGANAGALAGFEGLLAALFGQGGDPAVQGLLGGKATLAAAGAKADAQGEPGAKDKDADTAKAGDAATPATGDATLALLAAGAQLVAPAAPAGQAATGEAADASATGGGAQAKASAANGLLNTATADTAGLPPEQLQAMADAAGHKPDHPVNPGRSAAAPGQTVAAAATPARTAAEAAAAQAAAQAVAAAADGADASNAAAPPTQPSGDPQAGLPEGAAALAANLPPLAGATQAPVPPRPPAGKDDRTKGEPDGASNAKPAQAAPKPAGPAVAQQAANTPGDAPAAGQDGVDAASDGPQKLDSPDDATPGSQLSAPPSANTPPPQAAHNPVRGSPETIANLAAQIVKKLESKSSRFDLELTPAGLGKVDVRVEIGAEGRLTAAMTFDSHHAAADLKARANDLQRALEQAGFDLSGGISFDVADNGGQGRQAWNDGQDQSGQGFRGQAFQTALTTAGDAAEAALSGALRLRQGVTTGVDLRI